MYKILYNPLSSNGKSLELVSKVEKELAVDGETCECHDLIVISKDILGFVKTLNSDDKVVVLGGDGTLHYFANGIKDIEIHNEIYLYKGGTGNDFSRDFPKQKLIKINDCIKNFPTFRVEDGEEQVFVNSCGFGFDGAVCVEVNEHPDKKSGLAYFKSLLSIIKNFPKFDVEVEVDGVRHSYKKVWLSLVSHGKHFGGGMKISPNSDRNDDVLEFWIIHSMNFAQLLFACVSVFFGKHLWFKKWGVETISGRHFEMTASLSQPFQADGEVIMDVKKVVIDSSKSNK